MSLPENLLYAPSHEWIETSGAARTVGISDHAQHELTDVVYVELPKVGSHVKAGEVVCVIESVKAASDIYCPATGEIVAVNEAVTANPALVNTDPHGTGWLFKIKLDGDLPGTLLSPAAYQELIG